MKELNIIITKPTQDEVDNYHKFLVKQGRNGPYPVLETTYKLTYWNGDLYAPGVRHNITVHKTTSIGQIIDDIKKQMKEVI